MIIWLIIIIIVCLVLLLIYKPINNNVIKDTLVIKCDELKDSAFKIDETMIEYKIPGSSKKLIEGIKSDVKINHPTFYSVNNNKDEVIKIINDNKIKNIIIIEHLNCEHYKPENINNCSNNNLENNDKYTTEKLHVINKSFIYKYLENAEKCKNELLEINPKLNVKIYIYKEDGKLYDILFKEV